MSDFRELSAPSRCHRCWAPLEAGTIVARIDEQIGDHVAWGRTALDYHPKCWMDTNVSHFLSMASWVGAAFEGREALVATAERRSLAMQAAQAGPKARKKLGDVAPVEPATDPSGRPRVRVLLVGNAASTASTTAQPDGTVTVDEALREYVRDATITAPLREYALVSQLGSSKIAVDPSQPYVTGVLMMSTAVAPAPVYRARIADWLALGLPPPVLCVISDQDAATVDAYVLKLRAMVEQCGYSADECPVLTAKRRDRAMFEALAMKLDEHVASASSAPSGEATVRVAAQLAKAVEQGESDPIVVMLKRAQKLVRRARVAEKQSMMDSAQRCLADERTRRAAIELMQGCDATMDRAAVIAAMRAMLAPVSRPLNADFHALVEMLSVDSEDRAELDELLLAALLEAKPGSQRSRSLGDRLTQSKRKETALAIEEAITKAKGAMVPRLTEVLTAVKRNRASA